MSDVILIEETIYVYNHSFVFVNREPTDINISKKIMLRTKLLPGVVLINGVQCQNIDSMPITDEIPPRTTITEKQIINFLSIYNHKEERKFSEVFHNFLIHLN